MSVFVVDASVGAKWWFPEVHREAALRLRDAAHELHVPQLFDLEISSVVCKRVRRNEISSRDGERILEQLGQLPVRRHEDRELLRLAFEIANATRRALYDSLYLSLALVLEGQLVTADDRFYRALLRSPLSDSVLWVEEIA